MLSYLYKYIWWTHILHITKEVTHWANRELILDDHDNFLWGHSDIKFMSFWSQKMRS